MAEWSYAANAPEAVHAYSYKTFVQAIQSTVAWKLCQISSSTDGAENIVTIFDDLQTKPGGQVTYDLITKIGGDGVLGDAELAGQEANPTTYTSTLFINQLRHAVFPKGAMSQQRVPFAMRETGKRLLADWWAERLDFSVINQLTGNAYQTDVRYTGCNPTIVPSTGYQIFANGKTSEAALVAGDSFHVGLINNFTSLAHTLAMPIKPIKLKGMEIFGVAILHPYQIKSMQKNYTQGEWASIQLAAMKGGQITNNPIFTGAIGMIDNVVIHQDARIPWGDATQAATAVTITNPLGTAGAGKTNIARGVFVGAQALAMAFGRAYGINTRMKWFEELLDGGNQLRVSAGMIFGCVKNQFNNTDYATVTVSSYETATA